MKFAEFDPVNNAKRLIVATEDNVLASILFKNGEILWRKIFENSNRGIIRSMHVKNDIRTVVGSNPYLVRIWDMADGFLLHEWPLSYHYENDLNYVSYWSFFDQKLLHLVYHVKDGRIVVNFYNYKTGSLLENNFNLSLSWIHEDNR